MSARLKRNAHLLRALSASTPQKRKDILTHCSPDFLQTICEIALNVLKGNIRLPASLYKTLKKHKNKIRQLADRKLGLKFKRKLLLTQRGGFLPLLAGLIPMIGDLISGLVKRP